MYTVAEYMYVTSEKTHALVTKSKIKCIINITTV